MDNPITWGHLVALVCGFICINVTLPLVIGACILLYEYVKERYA